MRKSFYAKKNKRLVRNDYSTVIHFLIKMVLAKSHQTKKTTKIIDNEETIMKMKRHLKMTIDEFFSLFKE